MPTPRIPINQQDAFPILTIDQTAAPGDIQVVGGTITRYYSPSVLGVNNIQMGLPAGDGWGTADIGWVRTAPLDLRGMSSFVAILTRVLQANQNDGAPGEIASLYVEFVNSAGVFQPPSVPVPGISFAHRVGAFILETQAMVAGTQICTLCWVNGSQTIGGSFTFLSTIGTCCRFIVLSNKNPNLWPQFPVIPTYALELWASQI